MVESGRFYGFVVPGKLIVIRGGKMTKLQKIKLEMTKLEMTRIRNDNKCHNRTIVA